MAHTATAQTAEQKAAKEAAKAEKFKELAGKRVSKALDAIALIKGLANTQNYSYTQEQTQKLGEALRAEVLSVMERFAAPSAKTETKFSL